MNTDIKPYVYRCEHKETKKYYIGYRKANSVKASLDLGISYFTSCPEIRDNFDEYTYEVLEEYDTPAWAYEVEQRLIYECRKDPLLINKNYKRTGLIELQPKPVDKTKKKSLIGINKERTSTNRKTVKSQKKEPFTVKATSRNLNKLLKMQNDPKYADHKEHITHVIRQLSSKINKKNKNK